MVFRREIIIVLSITVLSSMAFGAVGNGPFARDYMRVTELRESKKTADFPEAAKYIQNKWSAVDAQAYGKLMAHTLKSWISACKESDKAIPTGLIQSYAVGVLSTYNPNKAENITMETEFDLVSVLHEKYVYSKGKQSDKAWRLARRQGDERWLHAWRRLQQAIDEKWDIKDVPVENVAPPEGAGGFPGISPELIKDPALRAEYEKAIRENQEKIRVRNEQLKLRSLKKRYAPIIEKYLVSTYSIAPFDTEELSRYLKEYGFGEEMTTRILATVAKNVEG